MTPTLSLTDVRRAAAAGLAALFLAMVVPCPAAKLTHLDGTVVTGRIVNETPDEIQIETSYGVLVYKTSELVNVERDALSTPVAAQGHTTVPLDYRQLLPTGPVNPFSPPVLSPLVHMAAQGITAEQYRGGVRPYIPPISAPTPQTTATATALPGAQTPTPTP